MKKPYLNQHQRESVRRNTTVGEMYMLQLRSAQVRREYNKPFYYIAKQFNKLCIFIGL